MEHVAGNLPDNSIEAHYGDTETGHMRGEINNAKRQYSVQWIFRFLFLEIFSWENWSQEDIQDVCRKYVIMSITQICHNDHYTNMS